MRQRKKERRNCKIGNIFTKVMMTIEMKCLDIRFLVSEDAADDVPSFFFFFVACFRHEHNLSI